MERKGDLEGDRAVIRKRAGDERRLAANEGEQERERLRWAERFRRVRPAMQKEKKKGIIRFIKT